MHSSRRTLLQSTAATLLADACSQPAPLGRNTSKYKVAIFSKHLLFLQGAALADAAASIGFDGIDLAVRQNGHVEPARVKQDLASLVALIRQRGLEVPMLTTDIADANTPYAEDIVRSMAELNIRYYRWGGFKYTNASPLPTQIESLKPRVAKLAALNARYGVTAMYHTHSGFDLVGAPIWDLHELLTGFDPQAVGVNYDIGHATIEGGLGGWIDSFRVIEPYLRGVAVKDFLWSRNTRQQWRPEWKPLGQGMVDFLKFFSMVSALHFSGPLQLHFEYPLAGVENGAHSADNRAEVFAAMKRDLNQLRSYLTQAGLAEWL